MRSASFPCRRERLGHAEVGHDRGPAAQEYVVRLDVTMHHASFVRVRQGTCHVPHDGNDADRRQGPLAPQPPAQRLPVHERHDEVDQSALVARRYHGDDVGVLQRRRGEDLAPEPLARQGGRDLVRQNLDDDAAIERPVERGEHPRHPSPAKLTFDLELVAKECRQSFAEFGVRLHLCEAGLVHRPATESVCHQL